MLDFWIIPTINTMYIRLQNYTNMVAGKYGIQTFKVVVVVLKLSLLSFDVFVPTTTHPLLFLDKWFVQIYFNISWLAFGEASTPTLLLRYSKNCYTPFMPCMQLLHFISIQHLNLLMFTKKRLDKPPIPRLTHLNIITKTYTQVTKP